jgi:putative peptidoglycan lipid II flippase
VSERPRWAHLAGRNPAVAAATAQVRSPRADDTALGRSSAAVGIGTALSRVTGLARTAALAYVLGAKTLADSYNLANTTPNIVYDLILGGVLSATLVPVVDDRFERDDRDGVDAVLTLTIVALTALTVVSIVAAPLIFQAYTWTSGKDAAELERAGVPLLRLFLVQVLFYGLTALGTALLNARRRFAAPAFAPILNNVVVCVALLWFSQRAGRNPTVEQVVNDTTLLWLLGAGTTLGIVAMTVALWPSLRRARAGWRWRWEPRNAAVRKVASLSGWTLAYVVANQVALVIVLALAARDHAASAYTYAFIFFQLPYGLFAVSLMTTYTPELASAAANEEMGAFRERLSSGLRLKTLVVLPSAVGMGLLARPLVVSLLGHGSFTGDDQVLTADVLSNFAVGLLGFSVYLFVLRAFYAMHDTRTPFLLSLFENAVNVVLAFALFDRYGVQGLAFSYSAAYLIAAVAALVALRRRIGLLGGRRLATSTVKIALASAAMGAVVWLASHAVGSPAGAGAAARLAVGVASGAAPNVLNEVQLRVEDAREVVARFARR